MWMLFQVLIWVTVGIKPKFALTTAPLCVSDNTFGSLHYNEYSPSFIAHIVVIKSPFMRPQIHLLSGVMDISVFQIHRQHVVTVVSLTP